MQMWRLLYAPALYSARHRRLAVVAVFSVARCQRAAKSAYLKLKYRQVRAIVFSRQDHSPFHGLAK